MADRASNQGPERYCPTCEQSFPGGERCPHDNTQLVTLHDRKDQLIGREVDGRFTIKERLGEGGMGTVYRAVQHSIGREVAIKVVTPSLVTNPVVIKRFLRESKLTSRLSHPHAVSVLDFGQTDEGLFFLVMELVVGPTLDDLLEEEGTIDIARACRIAGQICDALAHAHKQEIVHRDLKPSNVMLIGESGREFAKVLDFGLAKSLSPDSSNTTMTASGALLGTPAYLSPEAAQGHEVHAPGDLYSLGVMLYQMVTGLLPFDALSVHQLISSHAYQDAPIVTNVPQDLASLVAQLLRKNPADRPQSAAFVRTLLENIERSAIGLPRCPSPQTEQRKQQHSPVGFEHTMLDTPATPGPGLVTQLASELALADTSMATAAPEQRRLRRGWLIAVAVAALGIAGLLIAKPWARDERAIPAVGGPAAIGGAGADQGAATPMTDERVSGTDKIREGVVAADAGVAHASATSSFDAGLAVPPDDAPSSTSTTKTERPTGRPTKKRPPPRKKPVDEGLPF